MRCIIANENANKEYKIPITWQVYDRLLVQANSLEEALAYCKEHIDVLPLGDEPEYIDESYEIEEDMEILKLHNDMKEGKA